MAGVVDRGFKEVPVDKIVGSVGRWQNLRSDFFYKSGRVTARFKRVGEAMEAGKILAPLELYKVKEQDQPSQYYVVDGHHRVAMAKQMGQDAMDAHVIEYKTKPPSAPEVQPPDSPPSDSPESDAKQSDSSAPQTR